MRGDWFPVQNRSTTIVGACLIVISFSSAGLIRNLFSEAPIPYIARPPVVVQYDPAKEPPKVDSGQDVLRTITLDQAAELSFDGATLFVDAREPEMFREGRIEGAINLPAHDYEQALPALTDQLAGKRLIVYCDGGACESSMMVARKLIEAGHADVLVYPGGWPEWSGAGYPTTRD